MSEIITLVVEANDQGRIAKAAAALGTAAALIGGGGMLAACGPAETGPPLYMTPCYDGKSGIADGPLAANKPALALSTDEKGIIKGVPAPLSPNAKKLIADATIYVHSGDFASTGVVIEGKTPGSKLFVASFHGFRGNKDVPVTEQNVRDVELKDSDGTKGKIGKLCYERSSNGVPDVDSKKEPNLTTIDVVVGTITNPDVFGSHAVRIASKPAVRPDMLTISSYQNNRQPPAEAVQYRAVVFRAGPTSAGLEVMSGIEPGNVDSCIPKQGPEEHSPCAVGPNASGAGMFGGGVDPALEATVVSSEPVNDEKLAGASVKLGKIKGGAYPVSTYGVAANTLQSIVTQAETKFGQ